MRGKRNVLGIVFLAILALSSVLVSSAAATRSGHFTSDAGGSTTVIGWENATHRLEFFSSGLAGVSSPIFCNNASYHASVISSTTEEVRVKPTHKNCETTPEGSGDVVDVNFGLCEYKVTSRSSGDATAGLVCKDAGEKVVLTATHSGCVLSFAPQTVSSAVTYTTTEISGVHALTLNATGSGISFTVHGGLCIFVGTNRNDGAMSGSAIVMGKTTASEVPVAITAT